MLDLEWQRKTKLRKIRIDKYTHPKVKCVSKNAQIPYKIDNVLYIKIALSCMVSFDCWLAGAEIWYDYKSDQVPEYIRFCLFITNEEIC